MNKVCKEYISDVKKFFPIMGNDERIFLRGLNGQIEEFYEDKNITSKQELFEQYRQPYEIVNDYYESVDTEKIIKKIKVSKHVKTLISVLIALILITFSIFITFFIQRQNQFYKEEIVVSETVNNNSNIYDYDKEHETVKSNDFIEDDEIIENDIFEEEIIE